MGHLIYLLSTCLRCAAPTLQKPSWDSGQWGRAIEACIGLGIGQYLAVTSCVDIVSLADLGGPSLADAAASMHDGLVGLPRLPTLLRARPSFFASAHPPGLPPPLRGGRGEREVGKARSPTYPDPKKLQLRRQPVTPACPGEGRHPRIPPVPLPISCSNEKPGKARY